jgi:hypothetical protein
MRARASGSRRFAEKNLFGNLVTPSVISLVIVVVVVMVMMVMVADEGPKRRRYKAAMVVVVVVMMTTTVVLSQLHARTSLGAPSVVLF